jgi:hypothetical protein
VRFALNVHGSKGRKAAAILAAAGLLLSPALGPLPKASAKKADKDCADFPSQRAAQIFFLKHGGPRRDPDRLDGDDDGIACEDNPAPFFFGQRLP